ncbi:MAG: phosphoribosylaminoimidazolesuccinocarboxamide synthase [Raineya sp.]|jgi:phosphoribosylaminoimidazole-succinocarboxamide synthase|nr:phosphoribosylaminoimidazolesuccinocarboxamide synthase [Raineya sp.]
MAIQGTNFNLPKQTGFYKGKVRDVYYLEDNKMAVVVTDRISAFDVILPAPIPYKGQILNQIAWHFLQATQEIVPNWAESNPHPNITIGKQCQPFAVEMVIRGYLTGHAYREYAQGKRMLCGVVMPENMKENDKFPTPIITPTTKAKEGHDEDISREDIIAKEIVSKELYEQLEQYTRALYQKGSEMAKERGLILVDTKYEFGLYEGKVYLIDEIHTPDSSRYFYAENYQENQDKGLPQRQLSKEFVRQWLIENGFQGKDGQKIPEMTEEVVNSISKRYIELYEKVTGKTFVTPPLDTEKTIENVLLKYLT